MRSRIAQLVDLEERLAELREYPFEVAHMGLLVDHQRLDLVEHRRVCLVAVAAIDAARRDDADRRLLRQHGADLHGAGMGAQYQPRAVRLLLEIEGVVLLTGGMLLGNVELGEIIVVTSRCPGLRRRRSRDRRRSP